MAGKELEPLYGPGWIKLEDQNNQVVIDTDAGEAEILFRNFTGKEGQYNREGDRNFCVTIPPNIAELMIKDGWNVKQLRSREDGTEGDHYIQVSVSFKRKPPALWLRSSKGRVAVSEEEVEVLDWVDIARAEMIINPYNWAVNGNQGIKAYLKTLIITLNEDYLELKYNEETIIEQYERPAVAELESGQSPTDEYEGMDIVDAEIVEDDGGSE